METSDRWADAQVRGYYHDTRVAFPDQRHEMIALRHCDDAVVVEFYLLGTHLGPLGPVPPDERLLLRVCGDVGGSGRVREVAPPPTVGLKHPLDDLLKRQERRQRRLATGRASN